MLLELLLDELTEDRLDSVRITVLEELEEYVTQDEDELLWLDGLDTLDWLEIEDVLDEMLESEEGLD